MTSQAKLRENKAQVIKQLQKERPAPNASTPKKLRVNQGKTDRSPLETNILVLHMAILKCKAFYIQNQMSDIRQTSQLAWTYHNLKQNNELMLNKKLIKCRKGLVWIPY